MHPENSTYRYWIGLTNPFSAARDTKTYRSNVEYVPGPTHLHVSESTHSHKPVDDTLWKSLAMSLLLQRARDSGRCPPSLLSEDRVAVQDAFDEDALKVLDDTGTSPLHIRVLTTFALAHSFAVSLSRLATGCPCASRGILCFSIAGESLKHASFWFGIQPATRRCWLVQLSAGLLSGWLDMQSPLYC
jgi:hypothetical protein